VTQNIVRKFCFQKPTFNVPPHARACFAGVYSWPPSLRHSKKKILWEKFLLHKP